MPAKSRFLLYHRRGRDPRLPAADPLVWASRWFADKHTTSSSVPGRSTASSSIGWILALRLPGSLEKWVGLVVPRSPDPGHRRAISSLIGDLVGQRQLRGRRQHGDSDTAWPEVTWNLDDLLRGDHRRPETTVTALLDKKRKRRLRRFAAEYEDKVSELDGPQPDRRHDQTGRHLRPGRPGAQLRHLRFAADTADPANGGPAPDGLEPSDRIEPAAPTSGNAALDDRWQKALLLHRVSSSASTT